MEHSASIRRFPSARRALRDTLAKAVLLLLVTEPPATLGSQAQADGGPLGVLERVFREGEPGRIRQLAERGEKILMDSDTLGFPRGYYSVDQVCLVMDTAFRSRTTVRFSFLSGGKASEKESRIVAVGRWTFRIGRSRENSAQIAFTLLRRHGGWTLKEVRDVP